MKSIQVCTIVAFAGIACLLSCKNEAKTPLPSPPATASASAPASPKPEVYLYQVAVDKLNLREQSNKNAKVIHQFAEGDFVEGIGEVSANKEEATLREIPYNEPYYKVSSTTPEQHSGWAYSAALTPVYAGSRTTLPDLGKLSQFSNFLKTLNVKKVDSGKKAIDYVAQNLSNAQGTLADATFILLEKFLSRIEFEGKVYEITEKINWKDADFDAVDKQTFDMNKYPGTKLLAENGFRLDQGEGMIFPTLDWAPLLANFGTKVTPPMKTYMEQAVAEQKEKMWDDGGVIIPIEHVADRAAWWEKFNKDNPYFVRSEETKMVQRGLLSIMINGADNTPVFVDEAAILSEDFKKAWAYVQQKYAGTELGKAVKEMADLVAAEGGKLTKKVEALRAKYNEQ